MIWKRSRNWYRGRLVTSGSVVPGSPADTPATYHGEPYRDRLLTLPPFLAGEAASDTPRDIVDGLKLTAYFLERHVLAAAGRRLPAARQRLAERLAANVND